MDNNQKIYDLVRKQKVAELQELMSQKGVKISNATVMTMIHYLRQCANDTRLIDCKEQYSTKLDILKEIIEDELEEDDKIIIFSFYKRMAYHIQSFIKQNKLGDVFSVTGDTNNEERNRIKERFNVDMTKFLVCTDTLQYGANLQGANVIINFEPPWNPAIIEQRIARADRLGQTKKVLVYNMIAENTMDVRIRHMLAKKKAQFSDLIDNAELQDVSDRFSIDEMMKLILE